MNSSLFFPKNINIKPLFENIKDEDYFEPIKQLDKYFSPCDYFKKVLQHNKLTDIVKMKYIMCKPDIKCIFVKKKINIKSIVFEKKVKLNYIGIDNLKLQLHCIQNQDPNVNISSNEIYSDNFNDYYFIFYNKDAAITEKDKDNILIKTNTFIDTVIMSKIAFNKNTIHSLNFRFRDRRYFKKTTKILSNILYYFYKRLTLLEMESFILKHGINEYSFGIRKARDIDLIVTSCGKKIKDLSLFCYINSFIDINYEEICMKETHKMILKEYCKYFNINEKHIFFDENIYYYFYGLKIFKFDVNIFDRYSICSTRAFSLLIYLNLKLNKKIPIPSIPTKKIFFGIIRNTNPIKYYYIPLHNLTNSKQKKKYIKYLHKIAKKKKLKKYTVVCHYNLFLYNNDIKRFQKYNILNKNINKYLEIVDQNKFVTVVGKYLKNIYKLRLTNKEILEIIRKNNNRPAVFNNLLQYNI